MRGTNTCQSANQAKHFGIIGAALGGALGMVIEAVGPDGSTAKDYALTAGLGSVVLGSVFQVGGMMHVNNQQVGPGLLFTPILGTAGFATGVTFSRFKRRQSDIKNNITMGLVGLLTGGLVGGATDVLLPNNQ